MHKTTSVLLADRAAEARAIGKVSIWGTVATVALIPVAFIFGCLAGMARRFTLRPWRSS